MFSQWMEFPKLLRPVASVSGSTMFKPWTDA
jgi:hypothetical protein